MGTRHGRDRRYELFEIDSQLMLVEVEHVVNGESEFVSKLELARKEIFTIANFKRDRKARL